MAAIHYSIGIDLGGTKIEIIALDQTGQTAFRKRSPTPKAKSAEQQYVAILNTISALVTECEQSLRTCSSAIGIGIPGAVSLQTGLIKNANTTCLIGRDFIRDLELKIHKTVRLENDANCFALSEAMDGAAHAGKIVFGVILGTGVGGAFVINKQLMTGANAIAGEWGHNPLSYITEQDLPMQTCYCGKQGCIETYLSGPGCAKQINLQTELKAKPHSQKNVTSQDILQRNSPAMQQAYEQYVDRLARSLAGVINIIDPDVIVLGGGLSNTDSLYVDVPEVWGKYIFSDYVSTQLVKHQHGDSSGVRGAAYLTRQLHNA